MRDETPSKSFLNLRGKNPFNGDIIHVFCGPCMKRKDQLGNSVKKTLTTCKGILPNEKDNDCSFPLKIAIFLFFFL